ncbi:hypothetical protein AGABI2DRAFT_204976 [Agaricus bisporus var. bisporus H97]|uniref:hypothetical protein n=1 Tax=Agaricus bisporus var. bisporus (strain H97 / ATCC MYA-4626 / FGSC 10389) TaxID=936046 RepID=UPI00029F64B4|nr:hypothetical protein AGABI2DRAFT_204976 [Agaricus bisporus var. bisporus H97]EKV47640.1 hypothetical protein AGABI2DRAFT_204976 [Agaricus bisporus var. bisporus H97]
MQYDGRYSFEAADADVILVPAGGYSSDIRVHRCVLIAASPFFRDMFSLPQPLDNDSSNSLSTCDSHVPRIPISETREIFTNLLCYIYPIPRPEINSLEEIRELLAPALKYDFVIAVNALKEMLVSPKFLQEHPLRVYGIASSFDLEEEAKIASKYTLRFNLLETPLCDEMKYISAYSYQKLINLHRSRGKAASELIKAPRSLKCPQCNSYGHSSYGNPKWWQEFANKAKAELLVKPTTEGIFDMDFLKSTCVNGCPKCPMSLLEAGPVLMELKKQIDALPATI